MSEDTKTTARVVPKQARAEERRAKIIEAGKQVYAEFGIENFSLAKVHKIVGGSVGSVYRYYGNKTALLDEIAPERQAGIVPFETIVEKIVEVPAEMSAANAEKLAKLESVELGLKALEDWAKRLVANGEGKGDLKMAGESLLKAMEEKGLL